MCGIIGTIHQPAGGHVENWPEANRLQHHRGPDDQRDLRVSLDSCDVLLGHQRLAIIDLSTGGSQPMQFGNSEGVIVYNGELYNYCELRDELRAEGKQFSSHSDTEVVLTALHHWGPEKALEKFNGMWAFAWLDINKKRLLLSRDRTGEKPLYVFADGRTFSFASELKTLLLLENRKHQLNLQAVGEYLQQSLINSSTDTFYQDIRQVRAGTFELIDLRESHWLATKTVPYWRYPEHTAGGFDNTLIERVRDLFLDSVRIRLRSDVPVGVLLSGGIDSSSIAAAVQHINGEDGELNLLSMVSNMPAFDESPFIDRMAAHLKRPVEKIMLDLNSDNAIPYLEKVIWHNDLPVGSFSNVAHYLLMERAKELGITVVLSGQGADELLCGYRKYLGFYIHSLLRQGNIPSALKNLYQFSANRSIVTQFSLAEAKRYLPSWLTKKKMDIRGDSLRSIKSAPLGLAPGMTVQERQILDLQRFSVPILNHYEDRMSMAFSREIRLPFLDARLMELLISLPTNCKLRSGWTKYVFRRAMQPFLPPEIVWRKDKLGFVNPESEWLKRELSTNVYDFFSGESLIFKHGLVNREALLEKYRIYCQQPAGKGSIWFREIFNPLALEIWMRKFQDFIELP